MPDGLPAGVSRADVERHIREKGVTRCPSPSFKAPPTAAEVKAMERRLAELDAAGDLDPSGRKGAIGAHWRDRNTEEYRLAQAKRRRGGRPRKAVSATTTAPAEPIPARKAPETPPEARRAPSSSPAPQPQAKGEPRPRTAATKRGPGKKTRERAERIREMVAADWRVSAIADALHVSVARVYQIMSAFGIKTERAGMGQEPDEAKRQRYRELHAQGFTTQQIAEEMGVVLRQARIMLKKLGLTPNPAPRQPGRNGEADQRKTERAKISAAKVADRRRFRSVPVPMGEPAVLLPADHEAVTEARSYFPSRVMDSSAGERVLIDGCNNAKIGGDVLVGWLKGARIYTLTLEERATCPKDCPIWRGCYGNSMHHARRWRHGPALERRIASEVRQLCHQHDRILIRLHVLGDFYSRAYVEFWRGLLVEHPGLHVFGFTGWGEDSEIGAAVASVRHTFPRRWWLRHSGRTGPWGSFTIDFPTTKKRIGDALVCPEQREAMNGNPEGRHCGNCAACWSCDSPIVFVEH